MKQFNIRSLATFIWDWLAPSSTPEDKRIAATVTVLLLLILISTGLYSDFFNTEKKKYVQDEKY
jgi:hypothetical protein